MFLLGVGCSSPQLTVCLLFLLVSVVQSMSALLVNVTGIHIIMGVAIIFKVTHFATIWKLASHAHRHMDKYLIMTVDTTCCLSHILPLSKS